MREQDIADENGVAVYVGASHIEEPGDFIQLENEDAVGVLLTKSLPNALYLAFGRLTGKLQRLNLDLVLGDRRAVSPELFGRVEIRSELDASLSQRCFQLLDFSRGKNFAIDADHNLVSGPDITSRGFVYVKEADVMMNEATAVAEKAIFDCLDADVTDENKIRSMVRDGLSDFFWKKTKRSPMILPVILNT